MRLDVAGLTIIGLAVAAIAMRVAEVPQRAVSEPERIEGAVIEADEGTKRQPIADRLGIDQPVLLGLEDVLATDFDHPASVSASGPALCDPKIHCRNPNGVCVLMDFDDSDVQWQVCAVDERKKGLWIEDVRLRRTSGESSIPVLYEAGVAEIFVPYHDSNGTDFARRPYDMLYCDNGCLAELPAGFAGDGLTLPFPNDMTSNRLAVEVRERGLAWLCTNGNQPALSKAHRGEELVLWSVYDGGNYDNILEYSFRDDGSMAFRAGVTGFNAQFDPNLPPEAQPHPNGPMEAHMHNTLWRIDMDLNGFALDTALLKRHVEPVSSALPLLATDIEQPFNLGKAGLVEWRDKEFTSLVVEDASTNQHGNPIGYELVPLRVGTARHAEPWTHKDIGVSVYSAAGRAKVLTTGGNPESYLPKSSWSSPSVVNSDLVLWHVSSTHHDPHDEDRASTDTSSEVTGVTLIHWSGFDLVPHNLFSHNPLGGPKMCAP